MSELNEANVGRPTKYNEKTMERIYTALADGLPIKGACVAAGIGVTTLQEWRERYPEIEERMEQARERYRGSALQAIKKAIDNQDWRAAVAALKMIFPEYRESSKIDVYASACASGGPILAASDHERLLQRWEKAQLANAAPHRPEMTQATWRKV